MSATTIAPSIQSATQSLRCHTGHELKRFLVRIIFCLFAEDNGIFPQKAFELFIRDRTADDGSDLGACSDRSTSVSFPAMEGRLKFLTLIPTALVS